MTLAIIFVGQETERHHEELSRPRPEHAALIAKSQAVKVRSERYRQAMEWRSISRAQHFFLLFAAGSETLMQYIIFLVGSYCFRTFEIGNRIEDPFVQNGLE